MDAAATTSLVAPPLEHPHVGVPLDDSPHHHGAASLPPLGHPLHLGAAADAQAHIQPPPQQPQHSQQPQPQPQQQPPQGEGAPNPRLTCEVCAKVFSKPDKVREHMRIHTQEKPFA